MAGGIVTVVVAALLARAECRHRTAAEQDIAAFAWLQIGRDSNFGDRRIRFLVRGRYVVFEIAQLRTHLKLTGVIGANQIRAVVA